MCLSRHTFRRSATGWFWVFQTWVETQGYRMPSLCDWAVLGVSDLSHAVAPRLDGSGCLVAGSQRTVLYAAAHTRREATLKTILA